MPKKELTLEECQKVLQKAEVGYLAMSRAGQPYCLPFNFVYYDGNIYIHTGIKGAKWDYLAANPGVCFTVSVPGDKKTGESPCQYTYLFESVVVIGQAAEVTSPDEAAGSLNSLIDKYRVAAVSPVPLDKLAKLKMIKISIDKITGRQNF